MKSSIVRSLRLCLWLAVLSMLLPFCTPPSDGPAAMNFDLDRLIGRWEMIHSNGKTIEEWIKVSPDTMRGIGIVLFSATDTTFIEQLEIVKKDSCWYFIALVNPEGKSASVPFKLLSSSSSTMTFRNTTNDNPELICYQVDEAGHLHSYIEGSYQEKKARTNFDYVKSP